MSKEGFFGPAAFFHHRHPPTGWSSFEGPLSPHAFDFTKLEAVSAHPWSAPDLLFNAQVAHPLLAPVGEDGCPRPQCRRRRAAVRAPGPRRALLRLRPSRVRGRRLHRAAARHDVAARMRRARGDPADRGDERLVHAAGEGPGRRACDLRSGDARRAAHGRGLPRAAGREDLARRGQAAQRRLDRHLPLQPARCDRLARRPLGLPHQRARHPPADEPSLPPAAVGAHDLRRQPLRRLHLRAAPVRDRPGRDQDPVLPQQRRLRRSDLLSRGRFLQPRQHPPGHGDAAPERLHARPAPEGALSACWCSRSPRPTSTR